MKTSNAQIKWYKKITIEENMSFPVFFKKNQDWMEEAWSIILHDIKRGDQENVISCSVSFLSSEAPKNLLQKNSQFKYFRNELIAEGVIK